MYFQMNKNYLNYKCVFFIEVSYILNVREVLNKSIFCKIMLHHPKQINFIKSVKNIFDLKNSRMLLKHLNTAHLKKCKLPGEVGILMNLVMFCYLPIIQSHFNRVLI